MRAWRHPRPQRPLRLCFQLLADWMAKPLVLPAEVQPVELQPVEEELEQPV
jgi:hypothetical protein